MANVYLEAVVEVFSTWKKPLTLNVKNGFISFGLQVLPSLTSTLTELLPYTDKNGWWRIHIGVHVQNYVILDPTRFIKPHWWTQLSAVQNLTWPNTTYKCVNKLIRLWIQSLHKKLHYKKELYHEGEPKPDFHHLQLDWESESLLQHRNLLGFFFIFGVSSISNKLSVTYR